MATQYGFRLFEVEVLKGHKRKCEDFTSTSLGEGENAVDFTTSIERICASIMGVTTTGILRYRASDIPESVDEIEDTKPSIRLVGFTRNASRLDFQFRFGRRGSHDLAMADAENDDAPLNGKAPTNLFRAFLYLPTEGTKSVLAVEARNQICPADNLLKLLGVSSKDQDEERAVEKQLGWWRFRQYRMSDPDQWEKFITQGHAKGVSLVKHHINPDGTRGSKAVTVRQDGMPDPQADLISKVLGKFWIKKADKAELRQLGINPDQSNVEQLATLVEVDVNSADFDEAGFTWEGPDGSTKFIGPRDVVDQFTYPVGKRGYYPEKDDLVRTIESKLLTLASSHEIELDL